MSILTAIGNDTSKGDPLASSYEYIGLCLAFLRQLRKNSRTETVYEIEEAGCRTASHSSGIEESSLDLTIACQFLHATNSMHNPIARVRKLLNPGNNLLLIETTRDALDTQYAFGLLPGWWLSMDCIVCYENNHRLP